MPAAVVLNVSRRFVPPVFDDSRPGLRADSGTGERFERIAVVDIIVVGSGPPARLQALGAKGQRLSRFLPTPRFHGEVAGVRAALALPGRNGFGRARVESFRRGQPPPPTWKF